MTTYKRARQQPPTGETPPQAYALRAKQRGGYKSFPIEQERDGKGKIKKERD